VRRLPVNARDNFAAAVRNALPRHSLGRFLEKSARASTAARGMWRSTPRRRSAPHSRAHDRRPVVARDDPHARCADPLRTRPERWSDLADAELRAPRRGPVPRGLSVRRPASSPAWKFGRTGRRSRTVGADDRPRATARRPRDRAGDLARGRVARWPRRQCDLRRPAATVPSGTLVPGAGGPGLGPFSQEFTGRPVHAIRDVVVAGQRSPET